MCCWPSRSSGVQPDFRNYKRSPVAGVHWTQTGGNKLGQLHGRDEVLVSQGTELRMRELLGPPCM